LRSTWSPSSILCRAAVQSYTGTPGGGIIINVVSVTGFPGVLRTLELRG
jgi:hypothetical protein